MLLPNKMPESGAVRVPSRATAARSTIAVLERITSDSRAQMLLTGLSGRIAFRRSRTRIPAAAAMAANSARNIHPMGDRLNSCTLLKSQVHKSSEPAWPTQKAERE